MKKMIFALTICGLLSNFHQIQPFSFFGGEQKAEELLKEEEGDFNQAKKVTYKYFKLIYDICKKEGSGKAGFISKINGFKAEVDKLKDAKADALTEFGKMSVYLTKLYLEAKKVVKPLNEAVFNEKIKRTPDQTADELFELGINPLEIKNAPKDAAPGMGISDEDWEKMIDEAKAESRS